MKPPAITRAQREALTKEELIDLLMQTLERLHAEIDQLRAQIEDRTPPPTTSRNSSQPPSADQKPNRADARRPAKRGAHRGHARMTRELTQHPTQVIAVRQP